MPERPRTSVEVAAWVATALVLLIAACGSEKPAPGGQNAAAAREAPDSRSQEVVAGAKPSVATAPSAEPVRYGRDIRPILSDRCFTCHGADAAKREAKLRLDLAEGAVKTNDEGRAAVVPGDPAASLLLARVASHDPKFVMPPPAANRRPVSAEEAALLERWIKEGANYEPHWAFVPPVRPEPPPSRSAGERTTIDRFIRARLAKEGIEPSPEAEKSVLARRLFLDLTGLPPTPEEEEAFVADPAPNAYEAWVDKLLNEEPYVSRYAERMTTPWLDASRYADTIGIHTDAGRQMWAWRDWVLGAFRSNLPFDRFIADQIAGDLANDATLDQKVASGFNRNHVITDEGGAINDEYLVEYAVDRTTTTGAVFLGLTLGCVRCHDHKYDPISMQEFYGLYSFFNSIEEPGLYSQLPNPERAFEPFIEVPSPEIAAKLASHRAEQARLSSERAVVKPEEESEREAWFKKLPADCGVLWASPEALRAESKKGAVLSLLPDGSVLASGENPPTDEHVLEMRFSGSGYRLFMLEAMPDESLAAGRVGRAPNGNAVLTNLAVEAVSVADPTQRRTVRFSWIWSDMEQENGDFGISNAIDGDRRSGWAVDGHNREGGRWAMLLSDEPVGFAGGTAITLRLSYDSAYPQHAFGRVRFRAAAVGEKGLAALPVTQSDWYMVGPFAADREAVWSKAFGPEQDATIDRAKNYGSGNRIYQHTKFQDGRVHALAGGTNAFYLARRIFAPEARELPVALGSDDGIRVFLNKVEVFTNKVERGAAADQDKTTLKLARGENLIVVKIVNTGGEGGFYYKSTLGIDELIGVLAGALLPETSQAPSLAARLREGWRERFSPGYRKLTAALDGLSQSIAEIQKSVPMSMVMKELPSPRATYVLKRGQYDQPDKARPAVRMVPAALGRLPEGAPLDRRGLAAWLTAAENPLVARVAVNRFWETIFGTGLVRTSEDFGLQGEWPSHPELLDWLAVEFRESGWNVKGLLKTIVTSAVYRQSSQFRADVGERDPDNRLLAYFPRRRLSAETIRDQALYVSGLLVEKFGGPSVKPYQPEGLWEEVAMLQSNTRTYKMGAGADLYRRSLYTYWKRASPPPNMLALDAPTREFCTIRRISTNTPLQALVLWNDVQMVEAARALAERTLAAAGDDRARLAAAFKRCTGRRPDAHEAASLEAALEDFRARYRADPAAAAKVLEPGERPVPKDADVVELAAWTLVSNALLALDGVISRS